MNLGSLRGPMLKGIPIGIYRDQWGVLKNKRKLACFRSPGAAHGPLSDPLESTIRGAVGKSSKRYLFLRRRWSVWACPPCEQGEAGGSAVQ